jgi:hypothetical protein
MSVYTNSASSSLEQAEAYVRALHDLLGDRDPLEVLHATPLELRRLVEGLPEAVLGAPEREGKWSMRQVVRHVADSELVWSYRLRMVLAQERPPLEGYDQDAWASRLGYEEANVGDAVDEFHVVRRGNLRLLHRASGEALARVGIHAERGAESVADMMRLYAGHDLVHLRQVVRIRRAVTE